MVTVSHAWATGRESISGQWGENTASQKENRTQKEQRSGVQITWALSDLFGPVNGNPTDFTWESNMLSFIIFKAHWGSCVRSELKGMKNPRRKSSWKATAMVQVQSNLRHSWAHVCWGEVKSLSTCWRLISRILLGWVWRKGRRGGRNPEWYLDFLFEWLMGGGDTEKGKAGGNQVWSCKNSLLPALGLQLHWGHSIKVVKHARRYRQVWSSRRS